MFFLFIIIMFIIIIIILKRHCETNDEILEENKSW